MRREGAAAPGDQGASGEDQEPGQLSANSTTVPATSVYGAGRIKRVRATRDEMEERKRALYQIVEANQPTGIRFSYYTGLSQGLVTKSTSGYNKIQRAILQMRRDGALPWSWIVDTNRWVRRAPAWGSIEEILESAAASYRRDLWRGAPNAVEVWCESDSVASVLAPETSRWDVPLYPIKGQTSDTFAVEAAMKYRDDPREIVIIYVGDHDPAGYEIESNLRLKLEEHSERSDIAWRRLACTADQASELGLTGTPPKKHRWRDARSGEHHDWRGPAVEIEAIVPPVLRTLLGEAIAEYVDHNRVATLRMAEQSERELLLRMAQTRHDRFGGFAAAVVQP